MIYSLRHTVSESTIVFLFLVSIARTRGGVEDTMLEAKDTKKAEAKASLFEDRHFRTDNLEAKGQGLRTQAQVFKKKKKRSSKKFFKRSPIHRRTQNFWLGET